MKIAFVYPAFGSLAVETLSAVAKARGHDVRLVFDPCLFEDSFVTIRPLAKLFSMRRKVVREVAEMKPDLVAFSVVTNDFPWFAKTGRLIRNATSAPIIAGNIHVSSAPEYVLAHDFVSAIIRGEGDLVFGKLLDSLERGGIDPSLPNLGVREGGGTRLNELLPLIQDLDALPFPDKDIFLNTPLNASDIYTIMASRGCPYNCTFCNNNLMKKLYGLKGYVRSRSVGNVMEELTIAKEKYRAEYVNFYDEIFGLNAGWLADFAEEYRRRIGLPYIACTNPHVVTDEYARLLAESGCRKVDIGVQTINERKRLEVYNRNESTERIQLAFETLKKHGIAVAAENIINFPSESEADLVEMAKFYNHNRPDVLKIYWLRYYPSTEIVDMAFRQGVITENDVRKINEGENYGSIAIGRSAPHMQRKFYFLFALMQLMPERFIERFIERGMYRFLPARFVPGITYTVFRIFTRKSKDQEIMMLQHARKYAFYLKKRFMGLFGGSA